MTYMYASSSAADVIRGLGFVADNTRLNSLSLLLSLSHFLGVITRTEPNKEAKDTSVPFMAG